MKNDRSRNSVLNNHLTFPELLESRIAPAAVFVYTDVDGDTVTVRSSKGNSTDLTKIMLEHEAAQGSGYRIGSIDLTNVPPANFGEFDNTNLTISVKRGPHGDGHVDFGTISALNMPIGSIIAPKVSIQGLDCGNGTKGIGKLLINSYGTAAPDYFKNGIADNLGIVDGSVGSVHIAGDIAYGGLEIENLALMIPTLTVGSIYVGGNLDGAVTNATMHAGELLVDAAKIGSIHIKGSVIGGSISSNGADNGSGVLGLAVEGFSKSVTIGGNIIGGSGTFSGFVSFSAGTFTLGGSVIGGSNDAAGFVLGDADVLNIKGSIIGGVTDGTNSFAAGGLDAGLGAGAINIRGDLIAGKITGGTENLNGSISSSGDVDSIHIGGSVLGDNADRALILVSGFNFPTPGIHNAIGSLTIGGSIEYGVIAAGNDGTYVTTANLGNATNPNASIGKVTIDGNFYHSTIMAGTNDNDVIGAGRIIAGGPNPDTQSIGMAGSLATLGPVVIKGALLDDYDASGDSGFEAAQITSITAGGVLVFTHGDGLKFFDPNDFVFADEITPT